MRFIFIRQPWIACALVLTGFLFSLFLYNDIQESSSSADLPYRHRDYYGNNDGLPLFQAAIQAIIAPSSNPQAHGLVPLMSNTPVTPLHEHYPMEQRQALREHLVKNADALALLRQGAACDAFDKRGSLWTDVFPPGRPMLGRYIVGEIGSLYWRSEGNRSSMFLYPAARLIGCNALDAVLSGDEERLTDMIELAHDISLLVLKGNVPPDVMLSNLDCASIALDMLEEALNRMPLSPAAVKRLQGVIPYAMEDRIADVARSYQAYLAAGEKALSMKKQAAAFLPESPYLFDRCFRYLQGAWLQEDARSQLCRMSYLRNIGRFGQQCRYGGSVLLSPVRSDETAFLRDYLVGYNRYRGRVSFNALSSNAKALIDGKQLLRPYFQDYDSYLALAAYERVAACALAAYQYRMDRGVPPESLESLVPHYLDAVPRDPFQYEAPLRYRRDADRMVFYSVGLDLHDDSGERRLTHRSKRPFDKTGDIVFHVLNDPRLPETEAHLPSISHTLPQEL